MRTAPVSAILPTRLTRAEILEVLARIHACDPIPAEVRVHINGGVASPAVTEAQILDRFPNVIFSRSPENLGPGGARNALIRASRFDLVAGFDDDSFPIDRDYFSRVAALFEAYPEAAVLSAEIFHRGENPRIDRRAAWWVWDFIGCGCAYRRSRFLTTAGHVVRWVPYVIEEPDLCLQLMAAGDRILHTEWLRVRHDTLLAHHAEPRTNGGALANVALAGWVRYPTSLLWRIPFQVFNRFLFCLRRGRRAGLVAGLISIPWLLWRHRGDRRPVDRATARRFLAERALRFDAGWRVPSTD